MKFMMANDLSRRPLHRWRMSVWKPKIAAKVPAFVIAALLAEKSPPASAISGFVSRLFNELRTSSRLALTIPAVLSTYNVRHGRLPGRSFRVEKIKRGVGIESAVCPGVAGLCARDKLAKHKASAAIRSSVLTTAQDALFWWR